MITSHRHGILKDIRRLRQSKGRGRSNGLALLEGPHLVAEAVGAGLELGATLATPDFLASAEGRALVPTLPRPPLEVLPKLLNELADSDSPRGLIATAHLPRGGVETLPADGEGYLVYTDGIQDPGNLGALARVAEAAGARGLALSTQTAHPNHPRALRASAGSLLRLPAAVGVAADELRAHLPADLPWIALIPRGGIDLYGQGGLPKAGVLVLGAEGPGVSDAMHDRADVALTIPLSPPVESLNVTVAAALTLFELGRRR